MNKAALNMYAQVFMWRYIFIFVGIYLCGIVGVYDDWKINFIRNGPNVLNMFV